MKVLQLLIVFLAFPLLFHAQKTLTGLWTGALDNDSATVRKDQVFEIALTEYKGKVYGYSRMTFTVNDTLYHIIKRVKGTIEGDVCEVKDDNIITHNFPGKPDKGVKMISTFRRNLGDSAWKLDGDWKTTETRRHGYYAISGKISLTAEPDFSKSKLFPHLEELNIAKNVEFYAAARKKEAEASVAIQHAARKETGEEGLTKTGSVQVQQPLSGHQPGNTSMSLAADNDDKPQQPLKQAAAEPLVDEPAAPASLKKTEAPVSSARNEKKKMETENFRPEIKSQVAVKENKSFITDETAKEDIRKPDSDVLTKASIEQKSIANNTAKPVVNPASAAAFVAQRKSAAPQVFTFSSDSLVIKLYDNGEIDGDTVSVLLNGEIWMERQGLKASAIRKTIYIQPGQDELNLVLYAENLGKYPPNTGLLVVDDGKQTHQIRFSADLQQNASIIFRRKN